MSTLSTPRAILFDWDNTLVNTWPLIHTALNMTLRHMDHPEWTYERVTKNVKKSMRDSFPEMFGPRWKEAADHYVQSYRSVHLDQLTPLPGAEAMLASIPREKIFVGVVSNKQGPTLRLELEQLAWNEFFEVAVGAGDAARDKPFPDPVHFALKDSGITPAANVWFVGDTGIDLEAAQSVGATPILYGEHDFAGQLHGHYDGFPFAINPRDHAQLKALIEQHAIK